jgi:hypothetical protein
MKLSQILSFVLLIISTLCSAAEYNTPPPVKLLLLPFDKIFVAKPKRGSHGLQEYCYQTNKLFVIYSVNVLGEGYSFLKNKPNMSCLQTELKINQTNLLGLTVGLTTQEASDLLGVKIYNGLNSISWHYQRPIHNIPYDDTTNLDITIQHGLVSSVDVFNLVGS